MSSWSPLIGAGSLLPHGECFLVTGPRMIAWPSQSAWIRLCYSRLLRRAARLQREQVLLVNPTARARAAADARVSFAVHDVFTPWAGDRPDVIKVANLLRRDYFPDDRLRMGVAALLTSLAEGGHLLLVNNPRIKGVPCAAALYRRQAACFVRVAATDNLPDVDDLVQAATLPVFAVPAHPQASVSDEPTNGVRRQEGR